MNLVLFGDRRVIQREGICRFLEMLSQALPYEDTPVYRTWRGHFHSARQRVGQGEALLTVAQQLGQALAITLRELATAQQQLAEQQRETASVPTESIYKLALARLQEDASVLNLRALRRQVSALEQELTTAQEVNARQVLALEAERRTVAQREAAIAELQGIIAKQHLEFDALFGELGSLE